MKIHQISVQILDRSILQLCYSLVILSSNLENSSRFCSEKLKEMQEPGTIYLIMTTDTVDSYHKVEAENVMAFMTYQITTDSSYTHFSGDREPSEFTEKCAYIYEIHVLEGLRGMGYGEIMITFLEYDIRFVCVSEAPRMKGLTWDSSFACRRIRSTLDRGELIRSGLCDHREEAAELGDFQSAAPSLLKHTINCDCHEVGVLKLTVKKYNSGAIRLYTRLGFAIDSSDPSLFTDEVEVPYNVDYVIMSKSI